MHDLHDVLDPGNVAPFLSFFLAFITSSMSLTMAEKSNPEHTCDIQHEDMNADSKVERDANSDFDDDDRDIIIVSNVKNDSTRHTWLVIGSLQLAMIVVSLDK